MLGALITPHRFPVGVVKWLSANLAVTVAQAVRRNAFSTSQRSYLLDFTE